MQEKLNELKMRLAEIADLSHASAVLSWDQQTYMPPGGAAARGQQMSTLRRIAHEKFTDDAIGKLLDDLSSYAASLPYDSDDASLIRVTKRDYEKSRKVPAALVAEIAQASAQAFQSWQKAKPENKFSDFAPFLQKNLDLRKRVAECLGWTERIYDPLLDQFEPEMKTAQVEEIFAGVRKEIVPLVHAIAEKAHAVDDKFLHQKFDDAKQWTLGVEAVKRMGYSFERGRQDRAPHPFTTTFARDDVRITTRVLPKFFNAAFFATMHEGGHALYNLGTPPEFERTSLAGGASLGVHESQSRMWENLVGRSRAFWKFYTPHARKVFQRQLQGVGAEKMYRAVNRVQPSLIRVEADEVTYNLHIMLRFEMENALLEDRVAVKDLPDAWNAKMREYLGVTPPNDTLGVLQDIHWSYGTFGYFPTYSIGNFFAAQLMDKIRADIPDLDARIERGDLKTLLDWLRANIHVHGRKFTMNELAQKITGETLQTRSFVAYLKTKFGEIYGV